MSDVSFFLISNMPMLSKYVITDINWYWYMQPFSHQISCGGINFYFSAPLKAFHKLAMSVQNHFEQTKRNLGIAYSEKKNVSDRY